jgi:hypothetical protein
MTSLTHLVKELNFYMSQKRLRRPVQYTADIIVEIKNRDGTVVPMRALLDTGTRATIILRELVGKGRAFTNTKKITKWKTLVGTFITSYESLLELKSPEIR